MPREIIYTSDAPAPPPMYSQAVRSAGLIFVSGIGPYDPKSGAIVGTTIQEQTNQCLSNISAILTSAGSSLSKIVSATVILVEEDDFKGMNEEWVKWFPAEPPARQGAKLPVGIPGMRVSIAAIAEA
jgi:2-iminobutanoate/2-iminopropanoate deaminase